MSSPTATATQIVTTVVSSTWNIDPAHSAAEFKVRHMMISNVKGKFSRLSGVLKLDETDYTHSAVEVSIPAASVRTAWKNKPSWAVIAGNDRAIPPELEKDEAAAIKATSITIPSNHLAMLSHPREVAELIEQAATKAKRSK